MSAGDSECPLTLFLAYYFPPQNTSGAARPARFVKHLQPLGHELLVISAGDRGIPDQQPGVWRVPEASTAALPRMWSAGANWFQRCFLPYEEHLPWVPHAVAAIGSVCRRRPVEAVISTSPPIASHLAAMIARKRYGFRWIADFRDPMADNPFRNSWRSRQYDPVLERSFFRNADVIIANTQPLADLWKTRYPRWGEKIQTIWNGFDPGETLPARLNPARTRRVLAHIGSLYGERHPGLLLAGMERLIQRGRLNPETFVVRLIGEIEQISVSMEEPPFRTLRERGCLVYDGRHVPRAMAMQEMVDADGLVLLDINRTNLGLQVPAKLFDYMRSGLPILACTSNGSATESVLAGGGVPYVSVYPADRPADIDRKIEEFFAIPPEIVPPNDWFRKSFDASFQARLLSGLIAPSRSKNQMSLTGFQFEQSKSSGRVQ